MGVSGNISSIAAADVMSVRAPKPFATGDAIGRARSFSIPTEKRASGARYAAHPSA